MLIQSILILSFTLLAFGSDKPKVPKTVFETMVAGKPYLLSTKGTQSLGPVKAASMVPRGSAILTHAGEMNKKGIHNIIHVAPGAMTLSEDLFKPTLDGIKLSLINTVLIAKQKDLKCIAIPFIGGGIFLSHLKMSKEELAASIIDTISSEKPNFAITYVAYGKEDSEIFKKILERKKLSDKFKLVSGSITDFNVHKCSTIVNAANMEMIFGGGISGAIGQATKEAKQIDNEAKEFIKKYYLDLGKN